MDAFERLVGGILERQGHWVRHGFKVALSKEEKVQIGRPSNARWELDIVAYDASNNHVLAVECKSYLDSVGVEYRDLQTPTARYAHRYKLFNEPTLREVVLNCLTKQLVMSRSCRQNPKVSLCLVAGRTKSPRDSELLKDHFERNGWRFLGEDWIREGLGQIAKGSYEDDIAAVVAKLLLRATEPRTSK